MIFLFILLNFFIASNAYFAENFDKISPITIYNSLVNNDSVFDWVESKGGDASTNKHLINLFNISEYRLNVNSSSPCNFTGSERLQKCHQAYVFDWKAYNETILQLRKMFILRLGIAKLPSKSFTNVSTLRQTMKLFDAIEKQFNENNRSPLKHTHLDKENMHVRAVKSIYKTHDAIKCDQLSTEILKKPVTNALCLSFAVKYSDFYKPKLINVKQYDRTFSSVYLWLNINIKESSSKKFRPINQTVSINEPKSQASIEVNLKNGWNTIDITNLVKSSNQIKSLNESVFDTLIIKCQKDCLIEVNESSTQNKISKLPIVYVSTVDKEEPLLQINSYDENSQNIKTEESKRSKRAIEKNNNSGGFEFENLCKNNKADPKSKCCLVSYRVDFSVLKLTTWVQRPLSYPANFCFGHCAQARADKNGSYHYDIKNRINEYNNRKNLNTPVPTCCHPTKMASLSITYRNQGSQSITKVLPNMIVTECGCS